MGALVLFASACQILILVQGWRNNALAHVPIVDAEEYWGWASRIAAGHWIGATPFTSAPLYPYLLGLIRLAGGGLPSVYGLQAGLHLLSIALLCYVAARRFNPAVGLLAGGLYVLLTEPAYFTGRVLNCTLQLALVVSLWHLVLRAQKRQSVSAWALAGLAAGLSTLANPPAAMMIVLLTLWAGWQDGPWRVGLRSAAVFAGAATLVVGLAPLHNYLACREWIPLTTHAGLTFAQGNAPGANGTYTPVPGVSTAKQQQDRDTFRLYEQTTGQRATWSAVNYFLFQRGLDYWRSNPGATLVLLARKFYWFISSRNQADIYNPTLEIETGLGTWLHTTPLPVAWLALPGLLALGVLARRPGRYGPELILVLTPLLTVVLFFFSPRYRLPAVPVLAATCAWVLWGMVRRGAPARWRVTVLLVAVGGIVLGRVNQAVGFDQLDPPFRASFHHGLAEALSRSGRLVEAATEYRRAYDLRPDSAETAGNLGNVLRELGRLDEALALLQRTQGAAPRELVIADQLARTLRAAGRLGDALTYFRRAVQLDPGRADLHNNLGSALLESGDVAEARQQFLAALQIDPQYARAHANLAQVLLQSADEEGALRQLGEAVRLGSRSAGTYLQLAQLESARGEYRATLDTLRQAHALAPDDPEIANSLAWHLATLPGLLAAERTAAVRLAEQAAAAADGQSPQVLDTLGAALAAAGRYPEAIGVLEQAIALAEEQDATEAADSYRQRLALYRAGRPYVAPAPVPEE